MFTISNNFITDISQITLNCELNILKLHLINIIDL